MPSHKKARPSTQMGQVHSANIDKASCDRLLSFFRRVGLALLYFLVTVMTMTGVATIIKWFFEIARWSDALGLTLLSLFVTLLITAFFAMCWFADEP